MAVAEDAPHARSNSCEQRQHDDHRQGDNDLVKTVNVFHNSNDTHPDPPE